jgi:phosphoglycolate phosphatase-like HAD superfamily hydrolase
LNPFACKKEKLGWEHLFQTILFDIDGVMLSEERYFDASALTVYELLTSQRFLGLCVEELPPFQPVLPEADIRTIRQTVFAEDQVLKTMKQCGVNANWDMVYLQTAFQITEIIRQMKEAGMNLLPVLEIVRDGWSVSALCELGGLIRENQVSLHIQFGAYEEAYRNACDKQALFADLNNRLADLVSSQITPFDHLNLLWNAGQNCFQEWYLGDEYNPNTSTSGKRGFLKDEVPLVDPVRLRFLFSGLRESGITIGIATGRPGIETRVPLQSFGWLECFDGERVSTASDVLEAESAVPSAAPLSKPHPFAYLRSYLREANPKEVLEFPLPLPPNEAGQVLVVGDSVADLLAARAIGCRFAAVLTGLEGEGARLQFEKLQADIILKDVLELKNHI